MPKKTYKVISECVLREPGESPQRCYCGKFISPSADEAARLVKAGCLEESNAGEKKAAEKAAEKEEFVEEKPVEEKKKRTGGRRKKKDDK